MKQPKTVKELCEFIWYLEEKYNLLDFEIEGVKPWQAHRIEIYYELGRQCGVFEKELTRGMSNYEKIISLLRLLKNSILYNPLKNLHNVDKLIFSHPRSKNIDNKPIDIYTHYLIQELENSHIPFIEYEGHYLGSHIREYKKEKRYLDFITLYRNIKNRFINIDISDNNLEVLDKLNSEIEKSLNIKFNIKSILINRVKKFIPTYEIYYEILKKTLPKEIYVVVGYGRVELIQAAKDLNIKVIELQHGTFSQYHLGYSYPNRKSLDYFPDEFYVWNDYWKNLINFPIPGEDIKVYPFKYLENEKSKYKCDKIQNQMVVLCQGGLTNRIAKKMLDNKERFDNYDIIFKLHPEEYGRSDRYENLTKLKSILNITIVENVNLYELLAMSEYQAGVFSTALYEGVEFDCKTILFDLPGIEYMDKFIEMYKVKIV